MKSLTEEKLTQAASILRELRIDAWLTFVRESATLPDPVLDMTVGQHCTWHTAWILTAKGERIAVAGSLDVASIRDRGLYTTVIPYVQGIRDDLRAVFARLKPKRIAINYSTDSVMADGLTHGMYLTLLEILDGTPYASRLESSAPIISALRGRKVPAEIRAMKKAIAATLEIYDAVTGYLRPGRTEQNVADFILGLATKAGLEPAWDRDHCPAVFTGPEHAGAHFKPTARRIEAGHVLNIDFGVKVDGYCSDLQRTWYLRRKGESEAPAEVRRGFRVIRDAITAAARGMTPGAVSWQVDALARTLITEQGYPEFPHALGHQVGRSAHDGGVGLYPRWERYGSLPEGRIEEGQVFTLEPRLPIPGYGVATVEDMVWVRPTGVQFLSRRQTALTVV